MRARFLAWCHHVQWSPLWEWHLGLYSDHDGDLVGSGVIVHIDYPRWLRKWCRDKLPPPESTDRADISDILVASLLGDIRLFPEIAGGHFSSTLTYAEDRLNAPDG